MARLAVAILLATFASIHQAASAGGADSRNVTFNKDVAPILFSRCAGCHRQGEVAPFPLLSYRDASKRAGLIAELTARRTMPPWKPEPGAIHFADERRLTDVEIGVLERWSKTGAAEGDPKDLPPAPKFTAGWQLGEPDMIIRMAEPYTLAAAGPDEYRCFVLPLQVPPGKFIKSIEYRPGNRKIVHHAVITSLPHPEAVAKLAEGDGKSFLSGLAPPGRFLSGPLSIWTPGMEPHFLPGDLAAKWPESTDMVLQLHLHPSGKLEAEQSAIGIYLTEQKPASRLRMEAVSNDRIDIPPGKSDYEITASETLDSDATLFGIFPHMHLIGRSVHAEAILPDHKTIPLISITDWDFNWQYYYQYAKPLSLPAGTRIDVRFSYDNSASNPANPNTPPRRVTYGEQTTDEMAILIFDLITKASTPRGARPNKR